MPPTLRYTPDSANVFLGKGAIYFDRFDDNGVATGERHIGNACNLSITNEDEVVESYSCMDKEAALYKRTVRRRKPILKIEFEELVAENSALMLMGDVDVFENTVNTPVVDEAIVPAVSANHWYKVAGRILTAVSVEHGATLIGAAAATVTDDYVVDAVTGRIYIVPGGAIIDGDFIWVSYTPGDFSYEVVNAGTQGTIEGFLRFVGDPTEGPVVELEVWKVNMSPDGGYGLIGDDFGKYDLAAQVMKDAVNHPNEPYFRQINRT